nr:uncharacterized protein LOC110782532 [Spinacia oleracea]
MSDNPLFQYHPRCKGIKLTHLWFADDLIMCSKGDFPSVYLMLQAFKLFSDSTGMLAIKHKSAIYCCGMSKSDSARIVNVSGFTRSNLPFKYLGVPICAKRMSAAQCDVLVDRMISRIKVWSSRNFSYIAKMQLIKYVLLSLHMYWAQVFILPKLVLQNVTKVCTAFLWGGQAYSHKPSKISWDSSCCDKKYGGLGFRDVFKWNTASMGKYVWAIASKQDNVWIKWAEFVAMSHYSVKSVYEKITGVKPLINWDSMERLQTTAKLARIDVCASATCLLCGQFDENHAHLFFDCPYCKWCIMALKDWLSLSSISCNLYQLLGVRSHSSLTKLRKQVVYTVLAAAVYFI